MSEQTRTYGALGEFVTPEAVVETVKALKREGFRRWDVYSPTVIEEIEELLDRRRGVLLTAVAVAGGIAGAGLGYFIQYWAHVLSFPMNIGGRPLNAWPAFVPAAWEVGALMTVYTGFFAFAVACRLSRLHHPIFAAPNFERASQDRFFVGIEAADERYDYARIRDLFERHGALRVSEVPE
jgi:Protein of unknown function (DUF3341)